MDKNLAVETGQVTTKTYEVTARDIKRFAQAIDDPNPLYWDQEYAEKTKYGGVIAPPLFCQSLAYDDVPIEELRPDCSPKELEAPFKTERVLGGGSQFTIGEPVRPGDHITLRKKLQDVYKKQGRSGELIFVVVENSWTNQHGQMVAQELATYIHR